MFAVGVLIVWGGYAVTSWGLCLIKGYNVTLGQWVNPVSPFQWPSGPVPLIPATQIWPDGKATAAAPSQPSSPDISTQMQQQQAQIAQNQGRPIPGSVASRL